MAIPKDWSFNRSRHQPSNLKGSDSTIIQTPNLPDPAPVYLWAFSLKVDDGHTKFGGGILTVVAPTCKAAGYKGTKWLRRLKYLDGESLALTPLGKLVQSPVGASHNSEIKLL